MTREDIENELRHLKNNIYTLESLYIENNGLVDFEMRKFTTKIKDINPIIEYIEKLLDKDIILNKKSIIQFWKKQDNKCLIEAEDKLNSIKETVQKLDKCSKCVCAKCINQVCKDCCTGCENEIYTINCDKNKKFKVQKAVGWNMTLNDNKINEDVNLEIKALVEFYGDRNKIYAYMKNLSDNEHYLQVYNTYALTHMDDDEIFKQFDSDEEFKEVDEIITKYIG